MSDIVQLSYHVRSIITSKLPVSSSIRLEVMCLQISCAIFDEAMVRNALLHEKRDTFNTIVFRISDSEKAND